MSPVLVVLICLTLVTQALVEVEEQGGNPRGVRNTEEALVYSG